MRYRDGSRYRGRDDGAGGGLPTYDYIVQNNADWANIPSSLWTNGGRIGVAPGNYTTKTFNQSPSSRLLISGTEPFNPPVFDDLIYGTCARITLRDVLTRCTKWEASNANAAACLLNGTITDAIWERVGFIANYRGSYDDIDVVNALPEVACIAGDVTAGAVTNLEITQAFVGDLMVDGVHNLDFSNGGGTGATGTMTVLAGMIIGTNLTGGGSGYSSTLARTSLVKWTGQRRLLDWLGWGVRSTGLANTINPSFKDCYFKNVANALKPGRVNTAFEAFGNRFERVYMDHISLGLSAPDTPYPINLRWNFGRLPFSVAGKDAGDPHSDWIQIYGDDIGTIQTLDWKGILPVGNIFQNGNSRGSVQGHIVADVPANVSFSDFKSVCNHVASKVMGLGAAVVNPKDVFVINDNYIRHDHTDTVNNLSPCTLRIPGIQDNPSGGYYAYGRSVLGRCIAEAVENNGWGLPEINTQRMPNTVLGNRGATIAYTSVFANPTGSRDTIAEIVAAYTPIGAYAGQGAFGRPDIVDHVNRIYRPENEPTYIGFADLTGQALGSVIYSEWSRVLGGVPGRAISVSAGVEYSIASDASGTGATAFTAVAGTIDPGQFVKLSQSSSASNGQTTTATLNIGGQSFSWNVTTIATPFVIIDNGATARSSITPVSSDTGIKKIALAFRMKPDTLVANANLLAEAAAGGLRVWTATTTLIRAAFFASTRAQLRPTLTMNTTAKTHMITLDFSNPNAGQGCYWSTLEDGLLLNNTPGSGGVFDTRTTVGSGTDYGAFTGTAGVLFGGSNDLGVFGEGDGGGVIFDGQFEMLWMGWGGAGFVLPDITQSGVRSKFTADQIGANGQGPTGVQPQLFYAPVSVAEANDPAGIPNKGSIASRPLIKRAGTYT